MAKRKSQEEHDRMVKSVANLLTERGYKNICADLEGFTQPRRIVWESTGEGYFPDVTGHRDKLLRIFEVETGDSIDDEHTEDQWKLFSNYAQVNSAVFYIVFPRGAFDQVQKRLQQLGIQAQLMETP